MADARGVAGDGRDVGRYAGVVVGVCIVLLVLLALLGSVLSVGDRLADANAVLGVLFYLLVAALVAAGVVYPIASVAMRPVFSLYRLRDARGRVRRGRCRRFVEGLEASAGLDESERAELRSCLDKGEGADEAIVAFFGEHVVPRLDLETKRAAKRAFFATAVSQSPLVDAATMLSINFNLVRAIVARCGFRPSVVALLRLYVRIMASALVAGGLEDMDLDGLLAGVFGGAAGAHVTGAVVASAGQGLVNAFFTYRVGVMTRRYLCADEGPADVSSLRRESYGEALALMRTSGFVGEVVSVVREKASQAAGAAAGAAKEAVVQAGRSARDSVAAAASAVSRIVRRGTSGRAFGDGEAEGR